MRRLECVEGLEQSLKLSRLPKPPTALKSLNFKGSSPGQIAPLKNRFLDPGGYKPTDASLVKTLNLLAKNKSQRFDPWSFPKASTPSFLLHAYPRKLLSKPEHGNRIGFRPKSAQGDMFLRFMISKKVHKFAVVRSTIRHRIKEALNLIVTRGADGGLLDGNLTFTESDIGTRKWILQDWAYLIIPNLVVYRTPLHHLVNDLRITLKKVNDKAQSWESSLLRHSPLTVEVTSPLHVSLVEPPCGLKDRTGTVRSLDDDQTANHVRPKKTPRKERSKLLGDSNEPTVSSKLFKSDIVLMSRRPGNKAK